MLHLPIQLENAVRHWKHQLSCSNPECHGSRRMWKRISDGAGSVYLHGKRYCFPACFEKELLHRLEEIRPAAATKSRLPHRVPLGLLMLSRGVLDAGQLQKALAAQRESGQGRIGEWIEKLGFAQEEQVTAALAAQWGCPVLKGVPMSSVSCGVPFALLQRFAMVPVSYVKATGTVHMAFAGPVQYRALLAIEQMLQCRAEPCMISVTAFSNMLRRAEEEQLPTDHVFETVRRREEITRIISSYAAKLGAEDVRLAPCAEYIWARLEAGNDSANLLFRGPVPADIPHIAIASSHLTQELSNSF